MVNHSGHCSLAYMHWLFMYSPNLTQSPSYLFILKGRTVSNYKDNGWGIDAFYVFIQKTIHLTYKLSLPLICNFSNQIYLLILIWDHHTIINGPWEHNTTKPMQNDATHNNQLVVTVSFFSIESVFPVWLFAFFEIISNNFHTWIPSSFQHKYVIQRKLFHICCEC